MPTDTKVEVTLCLTDGTKLTRIEDLADITTFLEQHEEYVKIVRCKDCKHKDVENGFCEGRGWPMQLVPDDGFCDKGERSEE